MAKRGLTAIELLSATALAVMLMTAVLGVVGSLSRQEDVLFKRRPVEPWRVQLEKRLLWDLQHAQVYRFDGNSLVLTGLGSRDFAERLPTFEPAIIEYAIRDNSLIRRETHPESLSNANVAMELVLTGIVQILVGSGEEQEGPIPNRIAITFLGTNGTPLFEHAFVLH
jgi:hypothetical protein